MICRTAATPSKLEMTQQMVTMVDYVETMKAQVSDDYVDSVVAEERQRQQDRELIFQQLPGRYTDMSPNSSGEWDDFMRAADAAAQVAAHKLMAEEDLIQSSSLDDSLEILDTPMARFLTLGYTNEPQPLLAGLEIALLGISPGDDTNVEARRGAVKYANGPQEMPVNVTLTSGLRSSAFPSGKSRVFKNIRMRPSPPSGRPS